jgi:hypothetical protein
MELPRKLTISGDKVYQAEEYILGIYNVSEILSVELDNLDHLPVKFKLHRNFPNPFNPTTSIQYQIAAPGFVSLKAYDVIENEITTLVNKEQPTGSYEVEFDGAGLPSGIYSYRLQAGNFVETKKMVLLK